MGLALTFALMMLLPQQVPQRAAAPTPQASPPAYEGTLSQQMEFAVRANNVEKIKALLAAGANPDGDALARLPILSAIYNDNFEIVRLLAKAGANLNRSDGPGILVTAVEHGNLEMVRLLLSLGANANGDGMGMTPLHYALSMEQPEMVKVLIAAGADTKTEMANAQRSKDTNVIRSLQEALGIVPDPIPPEQIVDMLESEWEFTDTSWSSPVPELRPRGVDLEKTRQEMAARIKATPKDRDTLMLWARLQLGEFHAWSGGRRPASPSAEEALDRVLATRPHDAAALYYKGRIYGFPVPINNYATRRKDVDKAVEYLRQAVKYAPKEPKYRETLAYFLADQGHPGEARAILQAADPNDPLILLLQDLESLPVPPHAEFLTQNAISTGLMLGFPDDGIGTKNALLRVRTYSVRANQSEMETFFHTYWPTFRWVPSWGTEPHQPGDNTPPLVYKQFLHGRPGAWEPSHDLEEITSEEKNVSGIVVMFLDLRTMPGADKELEPEDLGRYLVFLDYRRK